ncbi:hypothetical protein ACFX2B_028799 [Malus domestica]
MRVYGTRIGSCITRFEMRVFPTDWTLSTAVGLLLLELDNSSEWLLGAELALLVTWLGPFRPETDPGKLELLLVAVAMSPLWRVRRGETGEPGSSSRKLGLLALQLSESRNR